MAFQEQKRVIMKRRAFFPIAAATPLAAAAQNPAPRSGMKIRRVRYYGGAGDAAMRQSKVPGSLIRAPT
jgi:hypothetical protein